MNNYLGVRKILAYLLYGITALISILLGSVYIFRIEFMPYHSAALGQDWMDLGTDLQVLIKALMMVAGAGWVALGVSITLLLAIPFRANRQWSGYAIPALILLFYIPTLIATLSVLYATPATPPWYGNLISCLTALVGFFVFHPNAMRRYKLECG